MTFPADQTIDQQRLGQLIDEAKRVAIEYSHLTGRPLGITGEIAEYEAVRLLGLKFAPVRQAGFDATDGNGQKYQIKGRVHAPRSQMLGAIRLKHDWDFVLLIILNGNFEPLAIYQATRPDVAKALNKTQSKARQRGVLSITEFIKFSSCVWKRSTGAS